MDRDWMPTTQSIERVSGRSQEREFSMQRQGDKISNFGTYSTAETAQTKKPETHVFDNSDVLRVSLPRTPRLCFPCGIRCRGSPDAKKPPQHHASIAIASRSVNRLTGMLAACNHLQIKFDVKFGAFGITMLGRCSLGTPIALV